MNNVYSILATGGRDDCTEFARVKFIHFHMVADASWLLGNYHCLCQKSTSRAAMSSICRSKFCPSKQRGARQRRGAELKGFSWEQIWMIHLQEKMGVFSFSLSYLWVLFNFLKRYPHTINAFLLILGIYLER